MAVKVAQKIEGQSKMWNSRVQFLKDNYIIRCVEGKTEPSQAGNPNTRITWEIVNCDPKTIGGELYEFDGVEFMTFHTTKVGESDERTAEEAAVTSQKCFNYYDELLQKCGIDTSAGWDDENPPVPIGKVVYACLYGKEEKQMRQANPDEQAKGLKQVALTNPVTGKPMVSYQIKVQEIIGAYAGEVRFTSK